MDSSFNVNGNKVSLREYLMFRLVAIEKRLDDLSIQINEIKQWQSKDEGKGSGSSMTIMYVIIILNLSLTSIALFQNFMR
jgi:tetrahydromethanopterin S-methyltransferase subunit G